MPPSDPQEASELRPLCWSGRSLRLVSEACDYDSLRRWVGQIERKRRRCWLMILDETRQDFRRLVCFRFSVPAQRQESAY